jgi:hypothetical protein
LINAKTWPFKTTRFQLITLPFSKFHTAINFHDQQSSDFHSEFEYLLLLWMNPSFPYVHAGCEQGWLTEVAQKTGPYKELYMHPLSASELLENEKNQANDPCHG